MQLFTLGYMQLFHSGLYAGRYALQVNVIVRVIVILGLLLYLFNCEVYCNIRVIIPEGFIRVIRVIKNQFSRGKGYIGCSENI